MSVVHDRMVTWLGVLDDDHIDEDYQEIQDGRRTITNHVCTVRGTHAGRPIAATYAEWFNVSPPTSMTPSYVRNVLDLFVADKSVVLEALARRRGFVDKLLGAIGIGGGLRPIAHPLFQDVVVTAQTRDAAKVQFSEGRFCDAVATLFGDHRLWKLEFQAETGLSSYYRISARDLGPDFLTAHMQRCEALMSAQPAR